MVQEAQKEADAVVLRDETEWYGQFLVKTSRSLVLN